MDQFLPIPGKSAVCTLWTIDDVTGKTPLEIPHMVFKLQRLSFHRVFFSRQLCPWKDPLERPCSWGISLWHHWWSPLHFWNVKQPYWVHVYQSTTILLLIHPLQHIIVMKYQSVRFGCGSTMKMIPTIKNASQSPQAQGNQSAKKAGWVGIIVVWQVKTNIYTSVS